jgi:pimeloyl-ACP methyl ester carboxylesterase
MLRALALLCCASAGLAAAALAQQVSFDAVSPLAARAEVAARMLHGLQHQRLIAHAASSGRRLEGQAIDPRVERWQLYLPDSCRDAPCGLLVWVSPWDQAAPPRDWLAPLEDARMAYVAAERSGNAQDVLDRRVPLALLGLAGARTRLDIDASRVYIGGFSGGGRVASRIAAGYPDVFRGGIFVATSDGLGTSDAAVPPLARLQALRAGRWWFAVGDEDPENAAITHDAFKHWQRVCALGSKLTRVTGWGHRTLDGRRLRQALQYVAAATATDAAAQAACERKLAAEATAALAEVERLRAAGERDAARAALLDAHRRYGGLIADEFARGWTEE